MPRSLAPLLVLLLPSMGCGARTALEEPPARRSDASRPDGSRPDGSLPDGSRPDADAGFCPSDTELCNDLDDDCDGRTDEGVLSECGDCRPCSVVSIPREVGGSWSDAPTESSGVQEESGSLTLGTSRMESRFAWIANTATATLTKLDMATGAQTGEYDSVLMGPRNGAQPPGQLCDEARSRGNCPSRTAVDLRGNVYVANRTFGNQGTVTKIANLEEDCIDRNGNGRIDTSRDDDGDGVIDRPSEFLGQRDECILWTVDVGGRGGIPRAVAIDADGFVWVGLHGAQRILKIDPSDGRRILEISLTGRNFSPYGAAISGDGTLWVVEAGTGRIAAIDTETGTFLYTRTGESREGCRGGYGIAIDALDRVWMAGFQCPVAMRYDPVGNTWFFVNLPDSGGTRGIAADDRGFIYVGASHTYLRVFLTGFDVGDPVARVTRFRADDGSGIRVYGTPDAPLPGLATVGVGLDDDRNIWMINQDSGTATRLNPETGAAREFPVGDTPYTYSDFTGFALRTFTAPSGFWRTVVQGCGAGPTDWEVLGWDATIPSGSRVEGRIRSARTRDGLRAAPWVGPFREQPIDLSELPSGGFLEVELTLISEDESSSPRIREATVQFNCPTAP